MNNAFRVESTLFWNMGFFEDASITLSIDLDFDVHNGAGENADGQSIN
jgi:hypothetical protein